MGHPVIGVIALMKYSLSGRIDMSIKYTLLPGARAFPRTPDSVQIGTDPPRCVLMLDAPEDSLRILGCLDGATSLGQVLINHNADPLVWNDLFEQLVAAELLVPVPELNQGLIPPATSAHSVERAALADRHGHAAAARIMRARDDALVVVRGRSAVSASIAAVLASAGVGHIYPDPGYLGTLRRGPGATDLGARLRENHPTVRVHPPAAHQHPTLVVMAGDAAPDLSLAATYCRNRIAHIAVTAGMTRVIVGPLVLPGRSSCLSCAHRHRTDADPGWPAVTRHLAQSTPRAPAVLTGAAACLAIGQILDHIDGVKTPSTVNGTLEWRDGDPGPRRRTWTDHPKCGCKIDS